MNKLYYISILLLIISCTKKAEKDPIPYSKTKHIAHKGSGSNKSGYALAEENTLEAAKYGFLYCDGIELDIQMSKDNTIWIFHDMFTKECDGIKKECIPDMTNNEIIEYSKCNNSTIDNLESVFKYHSENKIGKIISLDVKSMVDIRCKLNMQKHLNNLADELIKLTQKYSGVENYLYVESDNFNFLNKLEENNKSYTTFLLCTDNYDKVYNKLLKSNFDGISMLYTTSSVDSNYIAKLRNAGYKSQIWLVNDKKEIENVTIQLQPDYIQTDNIQLK